MRRSTIINTDLDKVKEMTDAELLDYIRPWYPNEGYSDDDYFVEPDAKIVHRGPMRMYEELKDDLYVVIWQQEEDMQKLIIEELSKKFMKEYGTNWRRLYNDISKSLDAKRQRIIDLQLVNEGLRKRLEDKNENIQ